MANPVAPTKKPSPLAWREDIDAIWKFLMEDRVVSSDTNDVVTVAGGRIIIPKKRSKSKGGTVSGGSSTAHGDFSLYDATDEDGPKLGIINGMVNFELPTGMSFGGDPPYVQSVTGEGYAFVIVTNTPSTGAITSVTIDTDISIPDNTEDTAYLPLGDWAVNDDSTAVNIGSGEQGIGSQLYYYSRCRDWFSSTPTFSWSHNFIRT